MASADNNWHLGEFQDAGGRVVPGKLISFEPVQDEFEVHHRHHRHHYYHANKNHHHCHANGNYHHHRDNGNYNDGDHTRP